MYKIENFSFTYPKDKKIIKDISFEIKKEIFGYYWIKVVVEKQLYLDILNHHLDLKVILME